MKDTQSRLAIPELGAIHPLLQLLNSDFPVIQHLALKTLQIITTDKDTRSAFREEQGLDRVIDVLNNMVGVRFISVSFIFFICSVDIFIYLRV